jgi:hypothetical protein
MIGSKNLYHLLIRFPKSTSFIATLRQKKQDKEDYLASSTTSLIDDIAILSIWQQAISNHPG